MKREHKSEQSYIDWLKSFGCVFYAPLTQGDFKDYISGNVGTVTGYGSMSWDSNLGMYQFTTPSQQGKAVLSFATNFSIGNSGYTALAMAKADLSTNLPHISAMSTYYGGNTKMFHVIRGKYYSNGNVNHTVYMGAWDNTSSKLFRGISVTTSQAKYFEDNSFYYTEQNNMYYIFGLPSDIGTINIAWTLTSQQTGNWSTNYANKKFYLSDVMIFNTALNENQINETKGML